MALIVFLMTPSLSVAAGKKIGTLTIGFIVPQSGSLKEYGKEALAGAEIALDTLQRENPKLMSSIRFLVEDDGSTPKGAEAAAKKLIDKRVSILVGSFLQSSSSTIGEIAKKHKKPHVIPASPSLETMESPNQAILGFYTNSWQGQLMSHFATHHLRLKHAAILVNPEDTYAHDIAKSFHKAFTKAGGEITHRQVYATEKELEDSIKVIVKQNPQGLFFPSKSLSESKTLIKTLDQLNSPIPLLGTRTWHNSQLSRYRTLTKTSVHQYYPVNFFAKSPLAAVRNFVKEFETKVNRTPSSLASMTYDSIMMIADAFKRAESNRPEILTRELYRTSQAPCLIGTSAINKKGSVEKPALILELGEQGRRYVAVSNPQSKF